MSVSGTQILVPLRCFCTAANGNVQQCRVMHADRVYFYCLHGLRMRLPMLLQYGHFYDGGVDG